MHQVVREHLEEYLADPSDARVPSAVPQHLASCRACREEVEGMRGQSLLLRSLKAEDVPDPAPGFYARVVERIDSQRASSIWTIFVDAAFGRRLAYACLCVVMVLGAYMVSSESQPVLSADSPEVIMAVEPHSFEVSGSDLERDRGNVLVALVSYEE